MPLCIYTTCKNQTYWYIIFKLWSITNVYTFFETIIVLVVLDLMDNNYSKKFDLYHKMFKLDNWPLHNGLYQWHQISHFDQKRMLIRRWWTSFIRCNICIETKNINHWNIFNKDLRWIEPSVLRVFFVA